MNLKFEYKWAGVTRSAPGNQCRKRMLYKKEKKGWTKWRGKFKTPMRNEEIASSAVSNLWNPRCTYTKTKLPTLHFIGPDFTLEENMCENWCWEGGWWPNCIIKNVHDCSICSYAFVPAAQAQWMSPTEGGGNCTTNKMVMQRSPGLCFLALEKKGRKKGCHKGGVRQKWWPCWCNGRPQEAEEGSTPGWPSRGGKGFVAALQKGLNEWNF